MLLRRVKNSGRRSVVAAFAMLCDLPVYAVQNQWEPYPFLAERRPSPPRVDRDFTACRPSPRKGLTPLPLRPLSLYRQT